MQEIILCIVSILGGIVGTIIYGRVTRRKKVLTYQVQSTPLITESLSSVDNLQISQNGIVVKDLTLSTVVLTNTGNEVIDFSDFATLGKPSISATGTVLTTKFNEISAPECGTCVKSPDTQHINIEFDYLDKNDFFSLAIYHTGEIKFTAKVKGGKVRQLNIRQEEKNFSLLDLIMACVLGVLSGLILTFFLIMATL